MTDMPPLQNAARPFRPALSLALRGKCPACGEGRMFRGFLKPTPSCGHCGQGWDVSRADDFPAYIVILLLGHILVPLMIEVNAALNVPLLAQSIIWPTIAVVLAALMIQPAKAAVITFQWSRRMDGFA